ncbi:YkvS family protein [Domibacillus aminovorans]
MVSSIVEKERIRMTKAEVGNIIEFKDGLRGIVEKVNENSVIVDLTIMENFDDLEVEEKTVVNHKNYIILHA